jgi:tetratricopeptide (TPR) repeat protein
VAGLLDQCEQALRAGDAAAAVVPLEAAKRRSEESGAAGQATRLTRLQQDLAVLRDLDAVDQLRWTKVGNKYPEVAEVASRYHEALVRFGAGPDAVGVEEEAARISDSTVRERLVGALDRLLRAEHSAAVRAVLDALDPDPFRDAVRNAEQAKDAAALVKLAGQAEALQQPAGFAAFLGESEAISAERRRAVLVTAVQRRPGDLGLLMTLGKSYPLNQREGAEERVRWFQAAVAAVPLNGAAHNNLGLALRDKGDLDGAIAEYREAIRLDPKYAAPHNNLCDPLWKKGDLDRAIAECQEAIRLDPKSGAPHYNLGNALKAKGDLDGAIAEYQQAILLDPKLALPHNNLGTVLQGKGDLDGAIAEYQKAILLDRKYAMAHNNLGEALRHKGNLEGAIAKFQEAILLDPKLALPHNNLGVALRVKGDLDGAIPECREAIRLDPNSAPPHYNLGATLSDKGDLDGAKAEYQTAIRLDPKYAWSHAALGFVLMQKGDLDGAIAKYREALRLDPKLVLPQAQLREAQRMRELLPRLPDVLAGKDKPKSPAEGCQFAELCAQPFQKRYAEAARLLAEAFATDPKVADDLKASHRYNAACYAALAGCGKGQDADKRDDKEKARLRGQALEWLRADLVLRRRQAGSAEPAQRQQAVATMAHWLVDSDLAGVRPGPSQVAMPAEERAAWEKLWADVKATLTEARKPAPPAEPGPGKK